MTSIPDPRRFHRHIRSYGMAPPEGGGEDRQLLKRLEKLHIAWVDSLKRQGFLRDPLEAGMAGARKD